VHPEVREWVAKWAEPGPLRVLDIGGRDINGTTRDIYPDAESYTVLDVLPGTEVDIVADAATWQTDERYDVVLCTEVFEHAAAWAAICRTAFSVLKPGGLFVVTCAGPGRPPHSAIDGGWTLHPGEHYQNVPASDLHSELDAVGFAGIMTVQTESHPCDTRAAAFKPRH
jgi:SAM-dependent methyltransferase